MKGHASLFLAFLPAVDCALGRRTIATQGHRSFEESDACGHKSSCGPGKESVGESFLQSTMQTGPFLGLLRTGSRFRASMDPHVPSLDVEINSGNISVSALSTEEVSEFERAVQKRYGARYVKYFTNLRAGRVGLTRASALLVQHIFEISWGISIASLIFLTIAYGVHRRFASSGNKKESRNLHRKATAIGDEESLTQIGFVCSVFGEILFHLWCLVPAVGYLQMILFALDHYLYAFFVPDQTWLQLGEPFLLVFFISHVVLFIQSYAYAEVRVFFMRPAPLQEATSVFIEDTKSEGVGTLCTVKVTDDNLWYIEYTCVRYLWDASEERFRPAGVDKVLGVDAKSRLDNGGLPDSELNLRKCHGPNSIKIEVPGLFKSVAAEFLSAIYIFQFCCIWVYMFYSTWNIAIIWLVLALISGTSKAYLVRRNQLQIQQMAATHTTAKALRSGVWQQISAADVVPGDILSVEHGLVPCDVAILQGCAVVNESMLTGEPMPVQRFAVAEDQHDSYLEAEGAMKRNFIFAGTLVMQSSGTGGISSAIGIAIGTGARTAKGSLVRMVLFPSPTHFSFSDQMPTVYIIMTVFTVVLFLLQLLIDQGHWIVAMFTGLCILTQCLQPNMPVSFTLAHSVAASRLRSSCGVICLSPPKIPVAGKVHVMVLDKTGTITKDGMDFAGIHPVDSGKTPSFLPFAPYLSGVGDKWKNEVPELLQWALASCHTVTKLQDGSFVGNAVEVSMLKSSGWELASDGKSLRHHLGDEIQVLRPLEFDHHRMTSGAVIYLPKLGRTLALIKGSYERIEQLVSTSTPVPKDYKVVTEKHAADQYYVLGMGMKELQGYSPEMTRDQLENDLSLLGLFLFRNEMKPDSPYALAQLREGGVRCVMCTGDNAITGVAIARRCNMLSSEMSRVIMGDVDNCDELQWQSYPEGLPLKHEDVMASDAREVDIVLTKSAFKILQNTAEIGTILNKVRVYARMKPDDKVAVINLHQDRGLVVGMVGDGGNDCGALRAAHVGIALSEAEASIVAPFSSSECHGTGSISLRAVPDLLCYGRATLSTNLATYMYFMVYALCVPVAKMTLLFMGNMILSEWTWLFLDIFVGSVMVATMTLCKPGAKLANLRPTSTLLGFRTFATVVMPVLVMGGIFFSALLWLSHQPFYIPYDALKMGVPGHEWQKKGDNYECAVGFFIMALQLPTAAYAFSFGGEHRRSVFANWILSLLYVFVLILFGLLLWSGPSELTCMFRVNCDSHVSNEMYIPGVQELSTGNLGGCFLGPQLQEWKEKLGDKYAFPDEANGCNPSSSVNLLEEIQVPSGALPWLGASTCRGPNNCFDHQFRLVMTGLMSLMVISTLVIGKIMSIYHPAPKFHFETL